MARESLNLKPLNRKPQPKAKTRGCDFLYDHLNWLFLANSCAVPAAVNPCTQTSRAGIDFQAMFRGLGFRVTAEPGAEDPLTLRHQIASSPGGSHREVLREAVGTLKAIHDIDVKNIHRCNNILCVGTLKAMGFRARDLLAA